MQLSNLPSHDLECGLALASHSPRDFGNGTAEKRSMTVVPERRAVRHKILDGASLAGFVWDRQFVPLQAPERIAGFDGSAGFLADLTILERALADEPPFMVFDGAVQCATRGFKHLIVSTSSRPLDATYTDEQGCGADIPATLNG